MRILVPTSVFTWLLLAFWTASGGQSVFKDADGFVSEGVVDSASVGAEGRVEIKSVEGLRGSLVITASPTNLAILKYHKRAKTDGLSRAIDYLDLVEVELSPSPTGVRVAFKAPYPLPWNDKVETISVEAELIVPENIALEVQATYYDITATGPFTSVVIPSSMERLKVSDVHGRLDLETVNQRVHVENATGDISVSTSHSPLTATNITCLDTRAKFENLGGDIRISDFLGQVRVDNRYGRIVMENVRLRGKRNDIDCVHGPIYVALLELPDGRLLVNNEYEDIELDMPEELSTSLVLVVQEGGRIEANNLLFTTDLVEHNRLSLVNGDGQSTIKCSIRGDGNIYVRGIDAEE